MRLARLVRGCMEPMHWFAAGLGVSAALLDITENHHLLAMLASASPASAAEELETVNAARNACSSSAVSTSP